MITIKYKDNVGYFVSYIRFAIDYEISSMYGRFTDGWFWCGICFKVFQMGLFGLKCIKGRNSRVNKKN